MLTMIKRFFLEGKGKVLKDGIDSSMGLKIMFAMIGAISVLMVLGTVFVAHMLMDGQYRALETRGREMGRFLGKAGTDALLHRGHPCARRSCSGNGEVPGHALHLCNGHV